MLSCPECDAVLEVAEAELYELVLGEQDAEALR